MEELTTRPVPARGAELDHGGPGEAGAGDRDRGPPAVGPRGGAHAGDGGHAAGRLKVNWSAGAFTTEVPPGVVTVTSTVAAASAGEMMVIEVDELTTRPVPAVVPNLTAVAPVKPVPVTVTGCPRPWARGRAHAGDGGHGGAMKVNWSAGAFTTEVPPGVVTVTSTVPAASAGEMMVIEVAELTTRPVPRWCRTSPRWPR